MSWFSKVWSTFGDMDSQKSWAADEEDGPADEVEYAHFLERFGEAAYRPDGKLKRPEDFTDAHNRELAAEVWQTGEQSGEARQGKEPAISPRMRLRPTMASPARASAEPSLRPKVGRRLLLPDTEASAIPMEGQSRASRATLGLFSPSVSGEQEARISVEPRSAVPSAMQAAVLEEAEPGAVLTTVAPFIIDPRSVESELQRREQQKRNDNLRIRHALDSLATLGHTDTHYMAKEFRITFVDWLPGGAAGFTNPFNGTMYISRDVHPTQLRLLETIVHECQHVRDWFAFGRLPKHDAQKRATPSEDEIQGDYLRAVLNGLIREEGIAPKPSLQVQPKEKKRQASPAGDGPVGSEQEGNGLGYIVGPMTVA